MPKDIIIENLISVESVRIVFTDMIHSLEDTGILVHKMFKEVASTSALKLGKASILLKSLKLEVRVDEDFMQVMTLLLKYSPNLEVLKLWSDENEGWTKNWQMHDPDDSIVCLESHLKSVCLSNFKGEENEIELLRFFLKNARILEKLTIVWASYADKSEEASEEVLKFPRTSSHVVTFLYAKREQKFLWLVR
ncbi:hypothetical protein CQW23_02971 [Capsicum baccatum]|uniref:FBD domain-containing protein n=1 Tax=Capsicum baccatum TaxID=33114 RepID=A0A2G2XSZ8_CAPBA|nr:hypothetical protein CQW23_02971 [Capsicum baccatum]